MPDLTAADLEEYERQDTAEAVFVRSVDKLLPLVVDLLGNGVRMLQEDYHINSPEELVAAHDRLHADLVRRFGDQFPQIVDAYLVLARRLEDHFEASIATQQDVEKSRSPTEIELKYLVDIDELPTDIDWETVPHKRIRQGYVAVASDGSETRVRSTNNEKFDLTIKSPGTISRDEQSLTITRDVFLSLWMQCVGRQVEKTRYYVPHGDVTVELDVYAGDLAGLVTAEIEFDGRPAEAMLRANTFTPPTWFGENVSEDLRYKNNMLAQHGIPQVAQSVEAN